MWQRLYCCLHYHKSMHEGARLSRDCRTPVSSCSVVGELSRFHFTLHVGFCMNGWVRTLTPNPNHLTLT